MGFGTVQTLSDAARGKMKSRTSVPVEPVGQSFSQAEKTRSSLSIPPVQNVVDTAYGEAMARRMGTAPSDLAAMRAAGGTSFGQPTKTYGNIIGGLTASRGGLSSEGKYGGFYSAEDLRSAIEGAAIGTRETIAPTLRAKAQERYGELGRMRGEAMKAPSRISLAGVTSAIPSVPTSMREATPGGYVEKIVNPQRAYAETLGQWYQEQAKPAEEYLQTAQQLEMTPLSSLAERIAVSQYGMNPDLARGRFADIDAKYWQGKRDQQYVAQYGMPYDEYMATQEEYNRMYGPEAETEQTRIAEKQASQQVEQLTGFKGTTFSNLVGRTPSQVADILATTFTLQNEDQINGLYALEETQNFLKENDPDGAYAFAEYVEASNPAAAGLLYALLYMSGYKKDLLKNKLQEAGLAP